MTTKELIQLVDNQIEEMQSPDYPLTAREANLNLLKEIKADLEKSLQEES